MLRFFSTHIAAGDFYPTGDVLLQLQALDNRQPYSLRPEEMQDLIAFVAETLKQKKCFDNKLRKKGKSSVHILAHLLSLSHRCIAAHSHRAGLAPTPSNAAIALFHQCVHDDAEEATVQYDVARRNRQFNTMSLDAIVPGLPHSVDNIQWVCLRVNMGKHLFNDKDFRVWAKAAFQWSGSPSSLQDIEISIANGRKKKNVEEEEEEEEDAEAAEEEEVQEEEEEEDAEAAEEEDVQE
jgi:hypothetical protein